MHKNTLKKVSCPICGSSSESVLYPANFDANAFSIETFSARRLPDKVHYQLLKCATCGLVRSSPVLSGNALETLYRKSTLTYEDEIQPLTKSYLNAILPVCKKLPKNAAILEIGCGNGFVLDALIDYGYKNVYGIEPSSDAVSKASKRMKKRIATDMLKPGLFPDTKFDLIFFLQVFDHIPDPKKFLKMCIAMLKPGGYVLSFNHNVESFSARLLGERSPIFDIEHTFLYSPATMTKIFNQAGFLVEKVYSPYSILTLKHLLWLLPIPKSVKRYVKNQSWKLLSSRLNIQLGNLCIVARKKK